MKQTQVASAVAQQFTFGVELECFLPYAAIREHGISVGGYGYRRGMQLPMPMFPSGWRIGSDCSVSTSRSGMRSVEVVSPVLRGLEGIVQVRRVVEQLEALGGRVNSSCGCHVHVGVASVKRNANDQAEWIGRLLYEVAANEKAVYSQTGTKRRENGGYCDSIKHQQGLADELRTAKTPGAKVRAVEHAAWNSQRYSAVNLTNLLNSQKRTVEFRAFAGTLSWAKVYAHIQTALALCERATERTVRDWNKVASGFYGRGTGLAALRRFFYVTGWVKGRRHIGSPTVGMAGWIAPVEDLREVRREMRRLAKRYDA
jgi:hypothetical protein